MCDEDISKVPGKGPQGSFRDAKNVVSGGLHLGHRAVVPPRSVSPPGGGPGHVLPVLSPLLLCHCPWEASLGPLDAAVHAFSGPCFKTP